MEGILAFLLILGSSVFAYMYWYFFHLISPTKLHHSKDSVHTKLLDHCPSIKKFEPSVLFVNSHAQTLGSKFARPSPLIKYRRENIQMQDGAELAIDWDTNGDQFPSSTPIILILHGLVGSSNSKYIKHLVVYLRTQNWKTVVLNARGCGNSALKTPRMFNASHTDDLRYTIQHIHKAHPDSPLFAIGFSLGANILTKYVGEEGRNTQPHENLLKAVVCISNPFDLIEASKVDKDKGLLTRMYNWGLTYELKDYLQKHKHVFKEFEYDHDHVLKSSYIQDFDERFVVKLFNYRDAEHYYTDASSLHHIPHINIPTLFLNALDDPIVSSTTIPYHLAEKNKHIMFAVTKRGGHIAFLQKYNFWKSSWGDRVAAEFIQAVLKNSDNSSKHCT